MSTRGLSKCHNPKPHFEKFRALAAKFEAHLSHPRPSTIPSCSHRQIGSTQLREQLLFLSTLLIKPTPHGALVFLPFFHRVDEKLSSDRKVELRQRKVELRQRNSLE